VGEIVISDPLGINNRLINLTDGTPIVLRIGTSSARSSLYNFRAFRPKSVPSESGQSVILSMYADHPEYWTSRTTKPFEGSSSDLLKHIANLCGLAAAVDATSDAQVWLPMNRRYCEFAQAGALAGYVNATSCMQYGLRLDRLLTYKNVDAIDYGAGNVSMFQTGLYGDPQYRIWPCLGYKPSSTSGYANNTQGYAHTQVSSSVVSASQVYKEVTKTRANDNMYVNSTLSSTLKNKGKATISPVDAGNTHLNYQRALYQNARSAALNSGKLELVTNQVTGIDLLDPVITQLVGLNSTNTSDVNSEKDVDGSYYVGAKTVYVDMRAVYYERFTLLRDGHNTNLNPSNRDL
jgi:hypothetical protein